MKIYCNICKGSTNHQVIKEEAKQEDDNENQVSFYDNWQIIKCLGCEDISFRHVSSNSDDFDPDTEDAYLNVKLYPIRGQNLLSIKPYYNVPTVVRNIYRETIDAYNNGLNLLCSGGLRAIIESICITENILNGEVEKIGKDNIKKLVRTKDLMGKINGLSEKGILTKNQALILHEHRYLGNDALHSLTAPSQKILRTAIEILENVLDSLYEINEKAGELIWRRQLKEKKKHK